jgi:hypothetical protein
VVLVVEVLAAEVEALGAEVEVLGAEVVDLTAAVVFVVDVLGVVVVGFWVGAGTTPFTGKGKAVEPEGQNSMV